MEERMEGDQRKKEGVRTENLILQLAGLLSDSHPAVMEELSACVADTGAYYKKRMGEAGKELRDEDSVCIQWLVMVECLTGHGIAVELDWKCELEDFAYFVKKLSGMKKYNLPFHREWFDEEESIEEWGRILNEKWAQDGVGIAEGTSLIQLDIESDSYIILPLPNSSLEQAERLARAIGQNLYPVGAQKLEDAPDTLITFRKKHPWNPCSEGEKASPDSCAECFCMAEASGMARCCYGKEGEVFQTVIKSKTLSVGQMLAISRPFRLAAMEIRKRMMDGKEIYVKAKLHDTLALMKILQKQQIAYEILPETPEFPYFYDCPKKFLPSGGNDWKYHLFDEERKKEWEGE